MIYCERTIVTLPVKKTRILIADDSRVIRDLIKSFYSGCDLELIEADNGRQAVDLARTLAPNLILLDMQMPVMSGYEAAAILKNDDAVKHIPILILTSDAPGEVAEVISGMYDGYLSKPFRQADLIDAIRQCLPNINKPGGDRETEIV
jgi:CheY-like chemotaxis protein